MNLVERAKNIILTPATEWETINLESTSTAQLYTGYIMLLAAIAPIAIFIQSGFYSIIYGLTHAIVLYVMLLIGVFIVALVIDFLAPNFGGQKSQIQALKLAAYANTPVWIAGILHIVPFLGILVLLAALYGLYVFYLGLPILMRVTKEKAVIYTVVVMICVFVIGAVFSAIATAMIGFGLWGGSFYGHTSRVDNDAIRQFAISVDNANKNANSVNLSSNQQASANPAAAATAAMAALAGNGQATESVDQNLLKAMLPDSVGGLKRNRIEAEKVGMGNFKVSKADAGYGDDQGHTINITITDAGSSAMFAGLAAWAMIEQDKETDDGYEKMGKVDGRPVHEKFNKKSQDGEYSVVVASRFVVEAQGQKTDMDALRQAVSGIGLDKLDAMKNYGVKQ